MNVFHIKTPSDAESGFQHHLPQKMRKELKNLHEMDQEETVQTT